MTDERVNKVLDQRNRDRLPDDWRNHLLYDVECAAMSFLIAPEDKTFIYALGPGGTNTFFCQVQSAGPERISKAEKEAVATLMADAPALLKALELCAVVLSGERMSKSSLVEALEKARALIAKHSPKKNEEKPTKYADEFMPRYSRDDEDWFFHPNDD